LPDLSIVGKTWRNRGRLFVPCFVSHLSALRPTRSREQWREYFAWAVETGFNGVRVFAGDLGWADGQTAASARSRLTAYLNNAEDFGLAVEVTALTGTKGRPYNITEHVDAIGEVARGRDHVIIEIANEFWHQTQELDADTLRALGDMHTHGLWAVGAPAEDEPINDVYAGDGGHYCTAHLDRGRDFWNQARRVREIFAVVEVTGKPCLNNEPVGADELDGSVTRKQRINDPAFFATLGALDRAFPGVGGVHHSQAGLEAVLPGPVQQRCADAYVEAFRFVAGILGDKVPVYRNSGHAGSPVAHNGSATRRYSFDIGDKAVTVGIGDDPDESVEWANGYAPRGERLVHVARDDKALIVWEVGR
jgi:hypothetical protein